MVTDGGSQMQENASVSGTSEDSCFAARPVPEQINECKQLINKVNSILESLNIPISRYKTELNDLKFTFSSISDSLKRTRLSNSNLTDQLSRATSKGEERRKWIQKVELDLSKSRDESTYLHRDNLMLLK